MKCPKCKKEIEYSLENPYRPFCSERCKMVDLGQWANEEFSIPSQNPVSPEDFEKEESLRDEKQHKEDQKSSRGGDPRGDLH